MYIRKAISQTLILLTIILSNISCKGQTDYWNHRSSQFDEVINIYGNNLQYNFDLLKSYLYGQEFSRLSNTTLEITRDDKIIFATSQKTGDKIRISAATILFIEELAVTLAYYDYLGNNNYQPIINYVLLLRRNMYKKSVLKEIIPTMPEALDIPANDIWARPDTDPTKNFAQNFLKSAVIWIIAHEIGHLALDHFSKVYTGTDLTQKMEINRFHETQADSFATALLSRVRLAPIGLAVSMLYYSLLNPIRAEFKNERDWTDYLAERSHPLWSARLSNLADYFNQYGSSFFSSPVNRKYYVKLLQGIAALLNSPEVLDAMILGTDDLNFSNLKTYQPLYNLDRFYSDQ